MSLVWVVGSSAVGKQELIDLLKESAQLRKALRIEDEARLIKWQVGSHERAMKSLAEQVVTILHVHREKNEHFNGWCEKYPAIPFVPVNAAKDQFAMMDRRCCELCEQLRPKAARYIDVLLRGREVVLI